MNEEIDNIIEDMIEDWDKQRENDIMLESEQIELDKQYDHRENK